MTGMKRRGFSLIELMVVISIIGVLMVVVIPSVSRSRAAARDGKRRAEVEDVRRALEIYRTDQSPPLYPAATSGVPSGLAPSYISSWPADPSSGQRYWYVQLSAGLGYAVCARLEVDTSGSAPDCVGATTCGSGACNYEAKNP